MKKTIAEIRELVAGMIKIADVPQGLTPYTCHALSPTKMIERVEEVVAALDEHLNPTVTHGFPARLTEGHAWDIAGGASPKVLVRVKNFGEPCIGRYLHELGEWQVTGFTGTPTVVEWWSLPEFGTGVSTEQIAEG